MDKIEKTMRWLEQVRDHAIVTLNHIKESEPNVSPMLYESRKEKAETALEAMKKQVPRKVITPLYYDQTKTLMTANCPSCGHMIPPKNKYCWDCGQRLVWDIE